MTVPIAIILLVAAQRLVELAYAHRNTQRLMAQGAKKYGAAHYPLIVILHTTWLLSLIFTVPHAALNYWLVAIFAVLQVGRVWVMLTLGPCWTTRIIIPPDARLVRNGPYKFCKHPNYLIVTAEIAVLTLAFCQWQIAVIFSVLNALVLSYRIHKENTALATI